MKITNTSIVKSETALEAITAAIKEQYNPNAAASHIDALVVDGLVGTCVITEVCMTYETVNTNYFIVTELTAGLMRVEFCSSYEMIRK